MAGFQTHITVSTITGIGYGVWGYQCGARSQTCVLAGSAVQRLRHVARSR